MSNTRQIPRRARPAAGPARARAKPDQQSHAPGLATRNTRPRRGTPGATRRIQGARPTPHPASQAESRATAEQLADALGVDQPTTAEAKASHQRGIPPRRAAGRRARAATRRDDPDRRGQIDKPAHRGSRNRTAGTRAQADTQHAQMVRELRPLHAEQVAAHDRACTAADRATAEQAVTETLARYATPTPVDPPPTQPDPSPETTASAERSARRRAASLKAAATVRARREAAEFEKHFQDKVNHLVVEIARTATTARKRSPPRRKRSKQPTPASTRPASYSPTPEHRTSSRISTASHTSHARASSPRSGRRFSGATSSRISTSIITSKTTNPKGTQK